MNWSLILSIAALALIAFNVVQLKRMRRSLEQAERNQAHVDNIVNAAKFGLVSPGSMEGELSTDLHVAFEQGPDGRIYAAGFSGGGFVESTASFRDEIERQRAVSSGSAADRLPGHLIDEIDARLSARKAERPRSARPDSDGSPPAHP